MRKALLLLFAVALMTAGAYLLFRSLSHPTVYSILRGDGIAVTLIALGEYLLWDDFLRQRSRRTRL